MNPIPGLADDEASKLPSRSPANYLVAAGIVALATVLRLLIAPWLTGAQFITLFPAVMLTTFLCGWRAGAAAVALSALAAVFVLGKGALAARDAFALTMFLAVALLDVMIISALLRANARLARDESRFRDLLESAPDAMMIVDRTGAIILINAATERLFGFAREELYGQSVERLIPPAYRDRHVRLVEAYMRSPVPRAMGVGRELSGQAKDGTCFPIEVGLSPLHNSHTGSVLAVVRDISAHKAAQEHQSLLIHELNHRVKNSLATVQSIAVQTLKTTSDPVAFCTAFNARLMALSTAHDVLTRNDWTGANLSEVVAEQLRPYQSSAEDRFELSGPVVTLSPRFAVALGMVFGELATNAAKYGALSSEGGKVSVTWDWSSDAEEPYLTIVWRETGGPPVSPPFSGGFGKRLIERSLAHELGGTATLGYPVEGVVCTLRFRPRRSDVTTIPDRVPPPPGMG